MNDEKDQMSIFDFLGEEDMAGLNGSTGRKKGDKEDYTGFVDKFKPKLTTDDCYTPEIVYNAIADYVVKRYNLDRADFVRPFWPGGDYEAFPYEADSVVVDNPPFSILKKIQTHYMTRGIKFFLFAPSLTLFSGNTPGVCYIPTDASITYENGAVVNTAFVTNLEPDDILIQVLPDLQKAVSAADYQNTRASKVTLPKYSYPPELITAAMCHKLANNGIALTIRRQEASFTRVLDDQRLMGKTIFGGGFLLSEKAAAEKAAAHIWELSEREKAIISKLGGVIFCMLLYTRMIYNTTVKNRTGEPGGFLFGENHDRRAILPFRAISRVA